MKNKTVLTVVTGVVLVLVIVVSIVLFTGNETEKGRDVVAQATSSFKPVELPKDSRELTNVPPPPINKVDKPEDKHIGVDMRGQKVKPDQTPGERMQARTTPSPKPKDKKDKSSSSSRSESPHGTPQNPLAHPRQHKVRQVSNVGRRFSIPSVGLDVPLGALNEVDGLIRPTNFTSAFQIRNLGVPYWKANTGTSYIVMHALDEGGIAPGNFLIDQKTREVRVQNGAEIKVGSKKFVVEKSLRIGKGLIGNSENIWQNKKGRLVIITCFPESNDNQVIIAKPVG